MFERFLAASDSGGKLAIDLTLLLEVGASGPLDLSISFQTADQSFIAVAPVLLPSAAVVPATLPQVDRATASAEAGYNADSQTTPAAIAPRIEEKKLWPWFVTLLVVTILILVTVLVLWNRVRKTTTVSDDKRASAATALAYLVAFDDASTRHAIDKTPWRMGRGRNNDLTVSDHWVSRLHAEIRSADDGILQLSDLESLNGVFVNDNRIDSIQLREGDNVDIGDIRFIFSLHDEDYASEEPTVLVRTRTPI
ncbi:MAG: FHA domain-containing protein [Gammaproteobacteria bacterium]